MTITDPGGHMAGLLRSRIFRDRTPAVAATSGNPGVATVRGGRVVVEHHNSVAAASERDAAPATQSALLMQPWHRARALEISGHLQTRWG